ncbi:MAG: hypothetical protein C0597_14535 [Marinilabiliales bacterium]|nr:MAG: hypothetical protein C0597_14535 [Marinilabiliales bacterium]
MTDPINTGLEIAENSLNLIDKLIDKIDKYKQIKKDTTTFLRLLYLEVLGNLEILNVIDFKAYKTLKPNDPNIKSLIKLLCTNVSEAIFYKEDDTKNAGLYEKLRKQGQVKNRERKLMKLEDGQERLVKGKFIYENVLQAISFTVVKIDLLRELSNLKDEELEILKPIKIDVRLLNINQRLLMIKSSLDKMPEVKEMAR